MKKQRSILLWTILALWVTACGNLIGLPPTLPNAPIDCSSFNVQINDVATMLPGETIFLVLNKSGFGWEYRWSATDGELEEPTSSTSSLTGPADEGTITVSVEVTDNNDCAATDTMRIQVTNPITATPTPTASPAVTETPEPTLTSTPTHTHTPAPSPTETWTPTPTDTPQVIPTPVPTVVIRPVITRLDVLPGGVIDLEWAWDGVLTADQHFAVRFWNVSNQDPNAHNSLIWLKETSYIIETNRHDYPTGEYYLNIAVVEGPSYDNHRVVVKTEDILINLDPLPPTQEPQCPPVCTDS